MLSESALGFLAVIALNDEAKKNVIEHGVIPKIVSSIKNNPEQRKHTE